MSPHSCFNEQSRLPNGTLRSQKYICFRTICKEQQNIEYTQHSPMANRASVAIVVNSGVFIVANSNILNFVFHGNSPFKTVVSKILKMFSFAANDRSVTRSCSMQRTEVVYQRKPGRIPACSRYFCRASSRAFSSDAVLYWV